MNLKVTTWAIPAVGALLISGSGDALAPLAPETCRPAMFEAAEEPLDAGQQALAGYLARRYYVAASQTGRFVALAYRAADEVGLDPLLVLAVISVESRFNPIAESVMGAKGLMQIIPKYHYAKLERYGGAEGGVEEAVLDPEANIRVGARILQEYVQRMGTLEGGLQFYNGALRDGSTQYAQKVFAEYRRLGEVAGGAAAARAAEAGRV
jgi:soluble lytic murein transglycosylase-like protein